MAFPALADSPSMERQPGPPLQPVAQPSSPAAAPPNTTMVSPPPSTQLAPLPSPPSPPSSSPPSVPVLASPPPVLTPAPNPPEPTLPPPAVPPSLPPVALPPTAPNSTATALVPSRTPPPAFTSIPETPLTSPSPPHIPTAPATSHPPPAPSSQSKSARPPTKGTLPPPINLSTPPQQPPVPVPTTPSLPEEAPPLPPADPSLPSPARHSQSPATPLAQVSPPNQPGVSAPVNSTSSKPPPATSSVTPSWNPPPTYLASSPLPPNESANASLPVAVGGKTGERPEVSHVSSRLIAGAAIGGVVLIVVFVSVLLFVCCKQWKKRRGNPRKVSYRSHSSSSGLKDSFTANLPPGFQYPYESISPGTGVHVIMASQQTFAPHHPLSSNGGSGSIDQGPEMHPSVGASLSISRGTFTYVELMDATDSFSEDNLLGEGGFGYVHKGVLANGKEIAVKQLKIGSHQGEREFQAELDIISHVHHKNLVTLLGYCISGAGRFLVYEFVPNHTLEFHLHGKEQPVLDWRTRLKIAIGTAKGLAYLHEDCSPKIIHRDIKAANILLDFNFEAKVSDFGLAKLFSDGNANVSHISTRVVGTFGYLAPEYASSGQLTAKSDVYSFGVVLLELITGCPPIKRTESSTDEGHGLVNWARPLLNQAMETGNFSSVVDPRLQNNCNSGEVMNMIGCAAACVRHSAWLRPQMSQIIHALERDGSLADLNEGIRPGESKLYSSSDMNRFRTILASQEHDFTRLSDATSEYGLYPSCSSSEAQHTR